MDGGRHGRGAGCDDTQVVEVVVERGEIVPLCGMYLDILLVLRDESEGEGAKVGADRAVVDTCTGMEMMELEACSFFDFLRLKQTHEQRY